MTALFDGDSLFYIIAYNFKDIPKDSDSIYEVNKSVDSFVESVLVLVKAKKYYGLLSDPRRKYFRTLHYKFKPYKGSRPPEEPWMTIWKPIIWDRLVKTWGFFYKSYLEADDLVSFLNERLMIEQEPGSVVICTPDKDMDQCPGWHFDFKKGQELGDMRMITKEQAHFYKWRSVISGDSSDDIAGIPFKGPKKAETILLGCMDPIQYGSKAKEEYVKFFGPNYGPLIFDQTVSAISMMTTKHPCYKAFKRTLSEVGEAEGYLSKGTTIFESV